ncbi:hypothetical protein [Burkholderia stagnalis]|uniref:hypothetical protein n=1 Tax=Burkholderia stagnalis TaxID=1503054 RepID=UPI00075539AC|nr:hypothetical protein [Burkholderia stagnalis]KVM94755.1 hypothetical protein WT07_27150 [Burkholderia stagnalis]KVN63061.1 hypothetical protein WT14_13460 [Burkholderia stagnalis]KWE01033.1 hypothetical protein WT47_00805 [Burkholderia stagnalis]KWE16368.1 hypothetical protein WT48_01035 [Burkholderia stagnalis]KWH47785.1 hypothetical protein WT61_22735 [Burkholderia stagnalis]
MHDLVNSLADDAAFRERAVQLGTLVPNGAAGSLDLEKLFERMQRFTAVRRREARVARLERAGGDVGDAWRSNRERIADALSGFCAALDILSAHVVRLQPLLTPALDDVIALAADGAHPLHAMLQQAAFSIGFSGDEVGWLFDELKAIGYRPVELLCADGFEDLTTLLAGVSGGEGGLLLTGFVRHTGDAAVDKRLEKIVTRFREKRVTANIFLILAVVLVAHAVVLHSGSH